MISNDRPKIEITFIGELHRNEKLSNFINGHIKNPRWNKRVWKAVHPLKKLPWIGKKIRGKLIARDEIKEIC